ncbi:MAG TPA: YggS family pyridoxal phosphate-dependent enzyme [Candidatus Tyrphobacter sp.]
MNVAERYAALRTEIDMALGACGRAAGSVTVVGVAKRQPLEAVREALDAGLEDIGENYVQEARHAFAALPRVRRHFLGHVQTNKAKPIAELFDVVQSVDRLDAGLALAKAAAGLGRTLPVLIQINISAAERFGCPPEEAVRLAERLRAEASLRVDGIMAIAPLEADRTAIADAFETAAKTFARVGGSTLSIGMSGDWREAVRAGSTMVRIGTALFGERGPTRRAPP